MQDEAVSNRYPVTSTPVSLLLARTRFSFAAVASVSVAINLLSLAGAFHSVQVFDRVFKAGVRPAEVDKLVPGLTARVRFTSLPSRLTPGIAGVLERISPDVLT